MLVKSKTNCDIGKGNAWGAQDCQCVWKSQRTPSANPSTAKDTKN